MAKLDAGVQPGRYVAVFAFPFATHAAPLLDLIRGIATSSPSTEFFFFSTDKSNMANFPDGARDPRFPNIKPRNVHDGVPDGFVPTGNPLAFVHMFLKVMTGSFRRALVKLEEEMGCKISCLVTDAFYWFGEEIAGERNVPWVPVWIAGPKSILSHILTDRIRETLGTEGYQGKSLDFIHEFQSLRPADIPSEVFVPDLSADPFAEMVHRMGHALPRSTALATNYYPSLVAPSTILPSSLAPSKYLPAGPFFLLPTVASTQAPSADDHSCLPFLDGQPTSSVAFISFGSVITPPPHELAALAGHVSPDDPVVYFRITAAFTYISRKVSTSRKWLLST
ncbi:hypothetical protein MLD38_007212 [Melastoma candidum]|uniref:Uncharacterized protein n=1 Tax=Melastoma candidum TaxID=119954 RepID=A0ACB9RQD9_9MYRT|nr:hypothetical protein MLD38_007212 [Melastoma candidum]